VAISEIKMIEKGVLNCLAENGEYPDSLSDIGMDQITDPWGNPYQYLRIDGGAETKMPIRSTRILTCIAWAGMVGLKPSLTEKSPGRYRTRQ
jgi:hypothetical protein